jgi:hypothetical protein
LPIFCILLLTLVVQVAAGQGRPEQQAQQMPAASRSIKLTAEQGHTIKEFLLKDPAIKKAETTAAVAPGDPAPQGVELRPFPSDLADKVPALKTHVFYVKGEQVVIVDPKDNTIADVIQ